MLYSSIFIAVLALVTPSAVALRAANAKQASSLESVAVVLPNGQYTLTNVGTGEQLHYVADRTNAIYPAKGKGTPVTLTKHKSQPWMRLQIGPKQKCLASAWGGKSADNAAVMYQCAVGAKANPGTLEPTKQWFLLVNVKNYKGSTSNKKAVAVLLAAQAESIKVRNKKIAAEKKAFGKRYIDDVDNSTGLFEVEEELDVDTTPDEGDEAYETQLEALDGSFGMDQVYGASDDDVDSGLNVMEEREFEDQVQRGGRLEKRSKAKSGKVVGTFFVIPSDHLIDLPASAVTAKIVMSRKVRTTGLLAWKANNKLQQWVVAHA